MTRSPSSIMWKSLIASPIWRSSFVLILLSTNIQSEVRSPARGTRRRLQRRTRPGRCSLVLRHRGGRRNRGDFMRRLTPADSLDGVFRLRQATARALAVELDGVDEVAGGGEPP